MKWELSNCLQALFNEELFIIHDKLGLNSALMKQSRCTLRDNEIVNTVETITITASLDNDHFSFFWGFKYRLMRLTRRDLSTMAALMAINLQSKPVRESGDNGSKFQFLYLWDTRRYSIQGDMKEPPIAMKGLMFMACDWLKK